MRFWTLRRVAKGGIRPGKGGAIADLASSEGRDSGLGGSSAASGMPRFFLWGADCHLGEVVATETGSLEPTRVSRDLPVRRPRRDIACRWQFSLVSDRRRFFAQF